MIFCVPKKDGYGAYTKLRVIRNGSFSQNGKTAINEWIIKQRCKMPNIPNLKQYAELLQDKNYFALRDLTDFFRQISLATDDCDYVGYSLFNLRFRDRRQPYGVASAPANCQYFAELLLWILDNKIVPLHLKNSSTVHIDDFVLAAKTKIGCKLLESLYDKLLNKLNVIISHKKSIHCCQKAIIYGIEWNLIDKTANIPEEKLSSFLYAIDMIIKYRVISGSALERLCGKIMSYAQLNEYSKPLCFHMITYIYNNIRCGYYSKTDVFILPLSIIYDLMFWKEYIINIKTVPINYILKTPIINITGSSDACNNGAGFIVGDKFAFYKFNDNHLNWHINQKEAHVILTLIETLKHQLTGQKIRLYVNNATIYGALRKKWSNKQGIMMFVYEICLRMIKYKIWLHIDWISSEMNELSDALSRYDFKRFDQISLQYNIHFNKTPLDVSYVNDFTIMPNKTNHYENDMVEYKSFINSLKMSSI